MQIGTLIVPNINLNGDTKQTLLDEYYDSVCAVDEAINSLPSPHGRNYPQPLDYPLARKQADRWRETLLNLRHEIHMVMEAINKQGK